eukprot:gene13024-9394_t
MGIVTRLFAFGEFGRGAAAATLFYSTAAVAYHLYRWIAERKERKVQETEDFGDTYDIVTIEELRAVMPAGKGGSCIADALKVMDYLDEQMLGFIERSPFIHLGASDATGVGGAGRSVIWGVFDGGMTDSLAVIYMALACENPAVGLCFQIPGNDTTLRVGGKATLSNDPGLLAMLAARGVDATMAIKVDIRYTFFHCAKAYIRSKLWQPTTWADDKYEVKFGPYFAKTEAEQCMVDERVAVHYNQVSASVGGERAEPS